MPVKRPGTYLRLPGRLSRRQRWPEKRRVAGTILPNRPHRGPSPSVGDEGDDTVVVPGVTISVDLDDWDARAKALGGTSNTLAAALTAKLGERMGRRRHRDGAVTVQLIVSERTEGTIHVRWQCPSPASASTRRG